MSKGWKTVGTSALVNEGNVEKREKSFQKAIRNTKSLSYEDLEKKAKASYEEMLKENEKLIKLYDEKKLTNKDLIKKAKALKSQKTKEKADK